MSADVNIQRFDVDQATEDDLRGYYAVAVASQEVDRPDEPRMTYENCVGRLKNPFTGFGPQIHWVARSGDELVGIAFAYFPEEENVNLALTEITVHPRMRRQEIGTEMLRAMLPEFRARGRDLVEGWQLTKGGAGERWATSLGFKIAKTMVMQLLLITETDQALWDVEVPAGYRLERWVGAAPEEHVASYARARAAIHDAPTGDSDFQSPQWSVERVREAESELRERNVEQRVVVAVHEASGEVAGLTEVELHPNRPNWAYQRDTAVLSAHRGHGLGRCVKAHMVRWLLEYRPGLERIYTGTSAENTHMIRVNHQLGLTTVRTVVAVNHEIAALESAFACAR